jgi:hypothetical protein
MSIVKVVNIDLQTSPRERVPSARSGMGGYRPLGVPSFLVEGSKVVSVPTHKSQPSHWL